MKINFSSEEIITFVLGIIVGIALVYELTGKQLFNWLIGF